MGRFIVVVDQSNEDEAYPSVLVSTSMTKDELTRTIQQAVDNHIQDYVELCHHAVNFRQKDLKYFNFNKETDDYSEAELLLLDELERKRQACKDLECLIEIEGRQYNLTYFADLFYGQVKNFRVLTPDEWFDDTVLNYSSE